MKLAHWRVWCTVDNRWEDWFIPSNGAPTTCPTDTAHAIDGAKTFRLAEDVAAAGRQSEDGALIVKQDPGTQDSDPKFYPHHFTVPAAAGGSWHDLDLPSDGTARMQYLTVQVKGPVLGDKMEVFFRADDSGTLAPEDTVLGTFGGICPAFHTDANGWSVPRREPQDQGSAKHVPAGAKVSVLYTAADAAGRELVVDAVSHE